VAGPRRILTGFPIQLSKKAPKANHKLSFTLVIEKCQVESGMRVLDVGCGAGDIAFLASDLVGPTGDVIGADRAIAAVQWTTARAGAPRSQREIPRGRSGRTAVL